ncbi:MAG: thioredoxin fold domain-containing protein [Euryarchaeota archaeon]|nr:thioredoxin fold domain-containing protein [Euryarchaeota archaeon]
MPRTLALLLLVMLISACTAEQQGMKFDSRRDYEEALKSGKPTIVEFSATWCSICVRMEPVVEKMRAKYGDRVNFVVLDFDRERSLAGAYGVRGTPTFILLNASGDVVGGAVGYIPEDRFEEMILELLEK